MIILFALGYIRGKSGKALDIDVSILRTHYYHLGGKRILTVNLGEVAPVVPPHGGSEEPNALVDSVPSSKFGPVRVEDHLVGAGLFNANPEIREALLQKTQATLDDQGGKLSLGNDCGLTLVWKLNMKSRPARSNTITLSPSCFRLM